MVFASTCGSASVVAETVWLGTGELVGLSDANWGLAVLASKGLDNGRATGAEILTEPVGSSIAREVKAGVRKSRTSEWASKFPSEYPPSTRGSAVIFALAVGASTAAIRLVRTGNRLD